MRTLSAAAVLVLGGFIAHRQAGTSYKTDTGLITLLYDTIELEGAEGSNPHVHTTGSPAVVTDTGQGAIVSGKSIDLRLLKLPKGAFAIRSAIVKGGGHVTLDSSVADEAAKEAAAKSGKPYVPPTGVEMIKAASDAFSFTSSGAEGTILIPGPWTCHQDSKGTKPSDDKKSTVAYVGSVDASGSSGEMHVFLKQNGTYDRPKSGHISGPVKFKYDRTEVDSVTKTPSLTAFTGSCDNVDMDFTTTPGTIIASGNVEIDGGETTGLGHTKCSRLVIYVDKDLKPIRYVGSGPATTTVRSKDGSH